MPQCQAINCTTRSGSKKSYFSMPDPSKSAEDKRLCKLWIDKLKNAKLDIKTFKASRAMVVCEDHFTDDCFVGVYANTVAESLSFRHSRKILKKGSVSTIVNSQPQQISNGERQSSLRHRQKREKALIKKNLIALRESHSKSSVAEVEEVQQSSLESRACVDKCVISGDEDTELVEQPPFGQTVVEYPPFEQATVEYPPFTATPLVMEECQYNGQPMCVEEVVVQTTVRDTAVPVTRDMGTQTEPSVSSKPEATFSCGHPCILCVPDNISKALESDHSYFQTPARKSSTMKITNDDTPDLLHGNEINSHVLPTHSTPRKSLLIPEKLKFHSDTIDEEDELNNSDMSYSFRDDSHDMTYVCDADLEDSESENEYDDIGSKCIVDENKFLVFESCLDQLFIRLKCSVPSCKSSIDPDDIKKDMTNGSNLHSSVYCASGHLVISWNSQPVLGKMAAGNLLMSAAILFSGLAHGRVEQFAKHLNLNFISHTTFNNIQREQLMPVVLDSWKILQHSLLQEVRASGRPLRLAGMDVATLLDLVRSIVRIPF